MAQQFKTIISLAFCAVSLISAVLIHRYVLGRDFLQEVYPTRGLSAYSNAEWAVIVFSALAAWRAAIHLCPDNQALERALRETPKPRFFATMTMASITTAVMGVALALHAPILFGRMVEETQLIAVLQEVFILAGLVALIAAAVSASGKEVPRLMGISGRAAIFLMSAATAFLLLEEISYGQHYFGWGTPEQFAANLQNETNLHNFYSNRFELVFYSGAMAMFVVLPLLKLSAPWLVPGNIGFFVPPVAMTAVALPMCALSYATSSLVVYQFYSLLIVGLGLVIATREGAVRLRRVAAISALFVFVLQIACIDTGRLLDYGYEYTEMRELIIALLICSYGVWLWRKIADEKSRFVTV
ncbi:MAG: hypothetical protein AAF940_11905 [Pseudomonadota bacterium]